MSKRKFNASKGPSQRQLRAGELIRHALVDILAREEFADPDLSGVSVTVSEIRVSPDLKHASCFVAPLGGDKITQEKVVYGLNRASSFLRGHLGKEIEMKFTPQLRFLPDESYEEAGRIGELLASPEVARDLVRKDDDETENNM
ncbi:30S ribosome-binding factor RbfA [Hirschia litorea]|uniref:Ribosome-binding factor A n=1 Tax=Hirschia litorea TaxID=1199156 RepID=A0ABW2IMU2_9PROT